MRTPASAATVLSFAFINRGASIGHHAQLGDFVSIGPGVTLAGDVTIGRESVIATGATILPGVAVGDNAVVGAGAVVTRNVPAGCLYRPDNRPIGSVATLESSTAAAHILGASSFQCRRFWATTCRGSP